MRNDDTATATVGSLKDHGGLGRFTRVCLAVLAAIDEECGQHRPGAVVGLSNGRRRLLHLGLAFSNLYADIVGVLNLI